MEHMNIVNFLTVLQIYELTLSGDRNEKYHLACIKDKSICKSFAAEMFLKNFNHFFTFHLARKIGGGIVEENSKLKFFV